MLDTVRSYGFGAKSIMSHTSRCTLRVQQRAVSSQRHLGEPTCTLSVSIRCFERLRRRLHKVECMVMHTHTYWASYGLPNQCYMNSESHERQAMLGSHTKIIIFSCFCLLVQGASVVYLLCTSTAQHCHRASSAITIVASEALRPYSFVDERFVFARLYLSNCWTW